MLYTIRKKCNKNSHRTLPGPYSSRLKNESGFYTKKMEEESMRSKKICYNFVTRQTEGAGATESAAAWIKEQSLPLWDLSDLYLGQDSQEIQSDIARVTNLAKEFREKYQNKVESLDAYGLHGAIKDLEVLTTASHKLSSFAFLNYCTDVSNHEKSSFYQKMNEHASSTDSMILFFSLEVNKIEEDALEKMLEQHKGLSIYRPWLRNIRAFKKYELSEKEEVLLNEKSVTSSNAWVKLFDESIAEVKCEWEGKTITLQSAP